MPVARHHFGSAPVWPDGPGSGGPGGWAGTAARHRLLREVAADSQDTREAIAEAPLQPAGSPCWWRAVNDALRICSRSLDREERGLLAVFGSQADPAPHDQLGHQWLRS